MPLSMIIAPGLSGEAAKRALGVAVAAAGATASDGPADAGLLLERQLEAGPDRPDAFGWASFDGGVAVQFLAGGDRGSEVLARALSRTAGGLVLACEALRTRDRYLLASFLAGRTVELNRCVEGIPSGLHGQQLCTEEDVYERFRAWCEALLGPVAADPRLLVGELEGGMLLNGPLVDPGEPTEPLALIVAPESAPGSAPAWRIGGVSVVSERDGALDEAAIEAAAGRLGVATGVELSADTGAFRVLTIRDHQPPERERGAGFEDLVTLVLSGV